MACNESNSVNVGGPILSHRESKYWLTSIKARKPKKRNRKSAVRSTPSLGKPSTWGRYHGNFAFDEET